MTASARRLRTAVRALAGVIVVALVLLAVLVVEYCAQHPLAGVVLALTLAGVFAALVIRERR
jgi:hypothetical protein